MAYTQHIPRWIEVRGVSFPQDEYDAACSCGFRAVGYLSEDRARQVADAHERRGCAKPW